ncbi:MAG TPA: 7TM diverse intracellular signaling domain-containing protein [Cyclobacteriaceae bacterium]|nr:7TM diverse intracellular signaling domain-containing protein [Cyclobacteriaceae bacterium]
MRIILFSLLLFSYFSHAEGIDTIRISEVNSRLSVKNRAYYLTSDFESGIESVIKQINSGENIFVFNKTNFGYNNDIYWLIIPLKVDQAPSENILLEFKNPHFDKISAWCLAEGKLSILGNETGDDFPFSSRSYPHRNFIWEVLKCKAEDYTLILRIEKRHSALRIPAQLWTENEHNVFYAKEDLISGIAYGMMMLVGIYSLVAGFFLKRRIYFAYTCFIVTAVLLLTTYKGLSFQFLYPEWGGFNSIFNVAITRLATFTLLIFSQLFLRTKLHVPFIHKLLNYVIFFYLATIVTTPFLLDFFIRHSMFLLPFMLVLNFIGNLLCLAAAIFSFKKQISIASFYLIAYLTMHSSGMLSIVQEFGWIEEINFDVLLLSAVIEILVFSFALTFLVKKIYDERNDLAIKIVKQQKESLNIYLQGIEKERERIAGELHDDIGSRLGNLSRLLSAKQHNDAVYMESQIQNLTHDVRKLSHQLIPPASLAKGLSQAVSGLVADIQAANSITINLQLFDVPENLNAEISKQTYRIIQETLNNIVKHAKATEVDIQIFGHEQELVVTIEDNDVESNTYEQNNYSVLNQIQTRATFLNAKLEVNTSSNYGSQLMLNIPI